MKNNSTQSTSSLRKQIAEEYRACDPFSRSVIFLLIFSLLPLIYLILNRLFVGFELERGAYWILHMIDCARSGRPLYAPVSPTHISAPYTPLYYWLTGALWKVFGSSLFWPRLVSLTSVAASVICVAAFVWSRTSRNLVLSLAAPCFVLATYSFMGPWMLEIHVNALHVGFGVAGFFLLSRALSLRTVVLSALLMSGCMLSKQTGLAYVVAGTCLVFVRSRKLGLIYGTISIGIVVIVCAWLNASSHGEFYRQTVTSQTDHPWILARLWDEVFSREMLGTFGVLFLMSLVPFVSARPRELWAEIWKAEYVLFGSGLAVACIAHPKLGSGPTQAIMAVTGCAICGCIGLHRLARSLQTPFSTKFVAVAAAFQLITMLLPLLNTYPAYLIDHYDFDKFDQVSKVFQKGSAIYYGEWVYMPVVFGQPPSGHYGDENAKWSHNRMDYARKPDSLVEPFRRQQFDYIILEIPTDGADPSVRAIADNYVGIAKLPPHPEYRQAGTLRGEQIVLQAKRLSTSAGSQPVQPPK